MIRKALQDLPRNLDATYDRILLSIDRNFYNQVFNCLQWLVFSVRPLLLNEIAEVFILDHEALVPFDESERLFNPNDVLKYLSGLVTTFDDTDPRHSIDYVDPGRKGKLIRLAHFSIKEYLVSERIHDSPSARFSVAETPAHLHISESCLAYHLHISETTLVNVAEMDRFFLWDYASWRWKDHLEKVTRDQWTASVTKRASRALAPASKIVLNMVRVETPYHFGVRWSKTNYQLAPPLYYTVSSGALQLSEFLIGNGTDVNAQRGNYGNALQAAAIRGNGKVVQLLLDNGANTNTKGGYYGSALQAAACCGDEEVVQLLLDNGGNINAQGGTHGNALQAAAYCGDEEVVQLLLDNGANINAQGGYYGNSLQAALIDDELKTTRLLYSRGAELFPIGAQWDEFLKKIESDFGGKYVERLRRFRADPEGYLGRRGEEKEEEKEEEDEEE